MRAWQRLVLGIVAGSVLVAALAWFDWYALQRVLPQRAPVASAPPVPAKVWPQGRMFTRAETYTFLDAAKRAERIADPLQRCLAYPDPPHSHWNRAAVAAYCQYRYQPIVTLDEARTLIQNGQAAELDRRLAAALHAQQTQPDARSRLDRIYDVDFNTATPELRSLVDAWQRQSPDSAFAYAASGMVYAEMSFAARGSALLRDTPESNVASMDRLARLADADLRKAIAMNPGITPAYDAMMNIGAYSYLGCDYALAALHKGLAADPDNFALYNSATWLLQPKWCGSAAQLQALWERAASRAGRNPLLLLPRAEGEFNLIDAAKYPEKKQLGAYMAVLDRVAGGRELRRAGDAARHVKDSQATAIYLSEALRFDANLDAARAWRIYALVEFDDARWGIAEADALLAKDPDNQPAYKARAWAELQGRNDLAAAQRDFLRATQLAPSDMWAWGQLGRVYAGQCEWDKTWLVADRLIDQDGQHSDGWWLRATVQQFQPRAGLEDTAAYMKQHFGDDPQVSAYVTQLEAQVRWEAQQRALAALNHVPLELPPILPAWYKQCRAYAQPRSVLHKAGH